MWTDGTNANGSQRVWRWLPLQTPYFTVTSTVSRDSQKPSLGL